MNPPTAFLALADSPAAAAGGGGGGRGLAAVQLRRRLLQRVEKQLVCSCRVPKLFTERGDEIHEG